MLKNFWYGIEFSHNITSEPVRVTALGQELVLYRKPDGTVICLSDLCVHRGGALSDGWMKDGCIVCPYHGWEYNEAGECVRIPANKEGTAIPKKARVDAYPVEEHYGFTWVFLGDLPEDERPPIPPLPEYGQEGSRAIYGVYEWPVHYTRAVENGMDFAHAPFVHAGSFGNPDEPEIQRYEVETTEWSGTSTIYLNPPPAKGFWSRLYRKEEDRPPVKTGSAFYMPSCTRLEVNLTIGKFVLFISHVPVHEELTLSKWVMVREFFTGQWADGDSVKRVEKIFNQDRSVVMAQRPELLPYDLAAELHIAADKIQIAYRQTRNRCIDTGWGIDRHKITSEYANVKAVVVPSPARRENPELAKAWVMKEVPTRPAKVNGTNGSDSE